MNWIFSLSALVLILVVIYSFLTLQKGEMDWISFLVGKGSRLIIRQPYPKNTTEDVLWFRGLRIQASRNNTDDGRKEITLGQIVAKEFEIPVADGKFSVTAKLYLHSQQVNRMTVLYFHGGGWVLGSVFETDEIAYQLARRSGMNVLSANYRLAPEHPFPAAVNDAYDILTWLLHHSHDFNLNTDAKIVLAGDSAGGNLAVAITTHYLLNKIKTLCESDKEEEKLCSTITQAEALKTNWHDISGVWLIYPVLNATSFSAEAESVSDCNGLLTVQQMEWFRRLYQGSNDTNESLRKNYLFSPLNSPEVIFSIFPPTILTLAKDDVLTAESMDFARKLETHHRRVLIQTYPSTIHGFVTFHPSLAAQAIQEAATAMKQLFDH